MPPTAFSRRPSGPPLPSDSPSRPSIDAVPVSTFQLDAEWKGSLSSYRNERKDCANPKPNEDRATVDPESGLVVIADGITRSKGSDGYYPNPSPSAAAAEIFCATVQRLARGAHEMSYDTLRSIVAQGNKAISEFNLLHFPTHDFHTQDRAGLAAVVAIIRGNTLWLASIADCWCVGFKDGTTQRLAWEKTSHSRAEYVRLGEVTARERLRNKPGNPLSYGAFTGEPEALPFVEYARIPLNGVSRLAFASDGLLRVAQERPEALATMKVGELIRLARILDLAHGETDDKTIVLLDRA